MEPHLRERLRTEGMDEWYGAADPAARAELGDRIVAAATALLDLRGEVAPWWVHASGCRGGGATQCGAPIDNYEDLHNALATWLAERLADPCYPYDATSTGELLRGLASLCEPDAVLVSFLHDLAEILALPRAARAEYRHHRLPGAPWWVRKLLLEYAVKALAVDRVVAALCGSFCAERCPDPPVGCCHILGYDLGLVPEAMLELQGLEATWRAVGGWAPLAPGALEHKCRYHTDRGCVILRWKSPACSGALCAALLAHLPRQYAPALLDPILEALAAFRNCDIARERVFRCMDALIRAGEPLLALGAVG